jgi:hypothetical protein
VKGRILKTVAALAAVLLCVGMHAQEASSSGPKWNVTLHGGAAYVSPTFTWRDEMMSTVVYPTGGVMVGYQTTEEDSPYAALYGFPNVGIGLGWDGLSTLRYNTPSRLKDIFNLYGFVERPLLRGGRVSLDFDFDLGMGFNRSLYDPVDNPLNRNFGSYLLVYVGGGLTFRVALTDRLEAGLAARFTHYSTGRLGYPNAGLNDPSASLSLRYRNARAPKRSRPVRAMDVPSRFFYEIYAGCGIHKCAIEWSASGTTPAWPIFAFGGSANWRYRPHLSTGLAVDVYAETAAFQARLEECERILYGDEVIDAYGPYKRFSGGIGLIQHLHYGNFSGFATVGAYVYRHYGYHDQRGKLYQRVGLKYVLPGRSGLFLAIDCKAHDFSRAAMMELTVGVRL